MSSVEIVVTTAVANGMNFPRFALICELVAG